MSLITYPTTITSTEIWNALDREDETISLNTCKEISKRYNAYPEFISLLKEAIGSKTVVGRFEFNSKVEILLKSLNENEQ